MRDLLRYLGALLLFGIGALHLYEYFADDYRDVPTIGVLFLLNFAGAVALGLLLVSPLGSLPGVRSVPAAGRAAHALVALGGIVFAAGTIIGLLISETGTLFGFQEGGYRTVIAVSLGLESAAVVVLAGFLALEARRMRTRPSR
ncbi:hypothetical protein [Actinomadura latina]|uniref:Uncharacterized protein n=1 Tax=Actinomadura latina TaxID=163603 RepID=A0A846YYI3_9ACTN|nr:hypothetical protein [Actinomadura latina]NKZ05579.1 hypothetical protein [Actinomadura latina]